MTDQTITPEQLVENFTLGYNSLSPLVNGYDQLMKLGAQSKTIVHGKVGRKSRNLMRVSDAVREVVAPALVATAGSIGKIGKGAVNIVGATAGLGLTIANAASKASKYEDLQEAYFMQTLVQTEDRTETMQRDREAAQGNLIQRTGKILGNIRDRSIRLEEVVEFGEDIRKLTGLPITDFGAYAIVNDDVPKALETMPQKNIKMVRFRVNGVLQEMPLMEAIQMSAMYRAFQNRQGGSGYQSP